MNVLFPFLLLQLHQQKTMVFIRESFMNTWYQRVSITYLTLRVSLLHSQNPDRPEVCPYPVQVDHVNHFYRQWRTFAVLLHSPTVESLIYRSS
jgi:hypothetical protein